jgi:hypothetical protein
MTISIAAADTVDFNFAPMSWLFAEQYRAEIEAHFAERLHKTPGIWNGRVLLARDCSVQSRSIHGTFFETDFASFIAWWDWNFPDPAITNCFSARAIRSTDGAFLLGIMGPHTARAGKIYFPAGIPDAGDIADDGRVDLAHNVVREVEEETGLTDAQLTAEPGWTVMLDGAKIALIRIMQASDNAVDLRDRILRHIARDPMAELANVRIVRSHADFDPMMPLYVTAFLEYALAR